jgi:iron(II)-dependent oxidoreductase
MKPDNHMNSVMAEARRTTDALFTVVRTDSLYERPIPERHRIVFYLGHLEAFDWNLLCKREQGMVPFREEFDRLFAFGIDPVEGTTPSDQPADWPSVREILGYNRRVREAVDDVLHKVPEQMAYVAIEHRLMHAETFAYMLHNLPLDKKVEGPVDAGPQGAPVANRMIGIPAGTATLGRRESDGFGWDNEFVAHTVQVPAFAVGKHKVTNGEYLDFVRAGVEVPHFWIQRDGEFFYRAMFGEITLPLDWPVYVTQAEAAAYAEWTGKSLPTEAQFHRAAYGSREGEERPYPWGDEPPDMSRGNFDFERWDPAPVAATPAGDSAFGVSQLVGNGWEWTSSVFEPFPGFEPFPFYPGYSANFFDGSHYVLKGGSSRTAARLLRRSFRNWFRPQYPYVYATFRCVEN